MRCWCVCVCVVTLSSLLPCRQIVAFVHREWDGASVWLSRGGGGGEGGGVVGSSPTHRPRSRRFRVHSFWTPSFEPDNQHPAVFLTPEPSTTVFWACCGTVIRSRLVSHVYRSVYSFSRLPSTETPRLRIIGPFRGCPKLELQSSSFALTRLFGY